MSSSVQPPSDERSIQLTARSLSKPGVTTFTQKSKASKQTASNSMKRPTNKPHSNPKDYGPYFLWKDDNGIRTYDWPCASISKDGDMHPRYGQRWEQGGEYGRREWMLCQPPRAPRNHVYDNGARYANIKHLERNFPKLFDERIDSVPITKLKGFTFLRLSQELRDEIYTLVVANTGPVEFWPTCGPSWNQGAEEVRKIIADIPRHGQLARVSKQFYKEVAVTLYGRNIFRFTGPNGWALFHAFVRQIGAHARDCLKHVQVCPPGMGPVYGMGKVDHSRYRRYDSKRSRDGIARDVRCLGLRTFKLDFDEGMKTKVTKTLARCQNLRWLELVVPSWWESIDELDLPEQYLLKLQAKIPGLEISVVRLRKVTEFGHNEHLGWEIDSQPLQEAWGRPMPPEKALQRSLIWKPAAEHGWRFKDAILGLRGSYSVQNAKPWYEDVDHDVDEEAWDEAAQTT